MVWIYKVRSMKSSMTQTRVHRRRAAHWQTILRCSLLAFGIAIFLVVPERIDMPRSAEAQPSASQAPDVVVTVDRDKPDGESALAVGVTHTQYSIDTWGDANAVSRAKSL